jgi:thioredoxin reductase (NADPH)
MADAEPGAETDQAPAVIDVAVVGAGPAGVSAAINVRNRGRSVVLLGGQAPFGRLNGPHAVANYAGFPAASGDDLVAAFRRHLEEFEVALTPDKVTRIVRDGDGTDDDGFVLFGAGEVYRAGAVVLATGVSLDASIEGEEDLIGQGVSYCVTCDGRLFSGRRVAYISFGPPGEEEASELAEAFGAGVTYLPQYEGERRLSSSVRVLAGVKPLRLAREDDGVHVSLEGGEGGAAGSSGGELVADAVFFYREAVAPRALLDGLETDGPHLVVDQYMRTTVPGVFAAGDCAGGPYQVAKAVGQGQVAALSAVRLLRERTDAAAQPG